MLRSILVSVAVLGLAAAGRADEEKKEKKLPKAVAVAVKSMFPKARVVGVDEEDEDGEIQYEVTLRYPSEKLEATLTAKGKVVKVEMKGVDDDKESKVGENKEKTREASKRKTKREDDDKAANDKKSDNEWPKKVTKKDKDKDDDEGPKKATKKDKDDDEGDLR